MKWGLLLIAVLGLFFLAGCTAEIGQTCGTGTFDFTCITGKCINNTCLQSNLNEPCKSDYHCAQGYCILGLCRERSNLSGPCEADYHCVTGTCKDYICQLGTKGDSCSKNEDCDKGFECNNNKCVSDDMVCKVARYIDIASWGTLGGIAAIIIGIIAAYFGIAVPGIGIKMKGIAITIGLVLCGIGLAALGVGIFSACY